MSVTLVVLAALVADALLGEPRRLHPLVGFGALAAWFEASWNRPAWTQRRRRLAGMASLLLLVLPPTAGAWWLASLPGGWLVEAVLLYLALGLRSLADHARPVAAALGTGDLPAARKAVAGLVSRDTEALDERGVAAAAAESVLENGSDAVHGALFWFLLAGAPGVVAYRLVNTLDAMWGYRTERLAAFGRAAARLDDLLNWVPARLTALTYALCSAQPLAALHCAWRQGARSDSPNAGVVMAAGAGALGVHLGGPGVYHGRPRSRPRFGTGSVPDAATIGRALRLVRAGVLLWLVLILILEWWLA